MFAPNDVTGASIYGGRYNPPGIGALYSALSASATILELRVHLNKVPDFRYRMSWVEVENSDLVQFEKNEVVGWNSTSYSPTQNFGQRFLVEKKCLGMIVPSQTSSGFDNMVVLNPMHGKYRDLDWNSDSFKFDPRLWEQN